MRARITELEVRIKNQAPSLAVHEAPSSAQTSTTGANLTATTGSPVVQPSTERVALAPVPTKPAKAEPFAFADWTWLNGNPRTKDVPLDTKFFTPEIRADVDYTYDFNHPKDDSIGGSRARFLFDAIQSTPPDAS